MKGSTNPRSMTSMPRMRLSAQTGTHRQERIPCAMTDWLPVKRRSCWASMVSRPARPLAAAVITVSDTRGGEPGGSVARACMCPDSSMRRRVERSARTAAATVWRMRASVVSRSGESTMARPMSFTMATWRREPWPRPVDCELGSVSRRGAGSGCFDSRASACMSAR